MLFRSLALAIQAFALLPAACTGTGTTTSTTQAYAAPSTPGASPPYSNVSSVSTTSSYYNANATTTLASTSTTPATGNDDTKAKAQGAQNGVVVVNPSSSSTSSTSSAAAASGSSSLSSTTSGAKGAFAGAGGAALKASFTHYGSGDSFGSGNCNTATAACSFYTSPGYSAAVSQNLFGVGPGAGAGGACGTCYRLTGETDETGAALTNGFPSIVVMINNLCPGSGNPLCSQSSLTDINQYGANVNFDLCQNSGAADAFFPGGANGAVGMALGIAQEVPCMGNWQGSEVGPNANATNTY
ncbi:MAG: hypothetical protein M1827_005761 [Pycnora praestabilis]|nr:MAG: hypothetical protein M1827_005761 [Pycnora praestabilis]